MKTEKIKVYLFEVILLGILFVALLVSNNMTQPLLALLLFPYMLVVRKLLRKDQKKSIYRKEVNYLLIGLAILYVGAFYLLGIMFYSLKKNISLLGINTLISNIIPIIIIIISSELIRNIFLAQDGSFKYKRKKIDILKLLTLINMVLCDVVVVKGVYNYETLEGVLSLIGFITCSSIACNLFYNYISKRYDEKGIIAYRLITSLYVYLIPVIPNMYIYFRTFLRMVYPYIMYLVFEFGYTKEKYAVSYREKQMNFLRITATLILTAAITMLVSCKFRYGVIVIGSGSMTGTLDYGDVVFFENNHGQKIENEKIVVYKKEDIRLVHRVVDVQNINGVVRYYTKGDSNEKMDDGYRTKEDIVGVYHFKIKFLGYPTLFINDLFRQK